MDSEVCCWNLRSFSSVLNVNKRLHSKGYLFSSSYYGDKCILWIFDSIEKMEDFVKNRFYWDDCFSSIVKWSEILTPQSRLVWLQVTGTPLNCWTESLFKNVGWLMGEPFWVEEENLHRIRLDRGKILALVPRNW
ncbi:hypothetical protein Dsin_015064 [Dipteronia sinensis]|uniref:DUF4283 domain-containing protein n=1 Tax=Dipteronia sinensis TaxID=43782 RepID=A0AAE0EAM5_9ROSI|nr:hypothetical protein Dsin_015064 [Dipteronia sinensis]